MTEYLEIEDKTVLITGDNLELLIKITEEFALEDTRMALTTNQENYDKVSQYILEEYDMEVLHTPMDLDDADDVEKSLQKLEDEFGEVDILVNTGKRGSNETLIDRLSTRSIYPLLHINKLSEDDNPFEKENKNIVITGASGRIGQEIAQQYALEGAKLILLSDNEQQLKEDVSKFNQMGVDASYLVTYLEDVASLKDSIESIVSSHDKIDFLVNAAGMGQNKDVIDMFVSLDVIPDFCIVFLQKFHNL